MRTRAITTFALVMLGLASTGCTSKSWRPVDEVAERQRAKESPDRIIAVQSNTEKTWFSDRWAYDPFREIIGIDTAGQHVAIPINRVVSVTMRTTKPDSSIWQREYPAMMFHARYAGTVGDHIFALRLRDPLTPAIQFDSAGGRLWLFDSTITGETGTGGAVRYGFAEVDSLQVERFDPVKTVLGAGGFAALVVTVVSIIHKLSNMDINLDLGSGPYGPFPTSVSSSRSGHR